MDTITVVKETHHSCSSNLVAKSVESPTKIDSISVDLISANHDTDTRKCEHFSIRGYASEMRKRDLKKSWPFALDGDQNRFKEQNSKLPPLLVPKFRWWSCQNCLQEIGDEGSTKEEKTIANNCSKLKPFVSRPHVSSCEDAVTCSSDLLQAGKFNVDSRKCDALACVNVNSSACRPLVSDKSEKKAENADIPVIGQTDILENNVNKEISNYDGIEVISILMQQTLHLDEKGISTMSKRPFATVNSLQLHNSDLKDNEVAGVKLPESNVKCTAENATETRQTGKSTCDQQVELVKGRESHGIASSVHRVPDASKTHTDEHPSLESDGCGDASSESAEVLPGTASGKLHRRKNRKVRLLTELLGKNEDEKTNLTSTDDSPSSTIPDESIGKNSISASQGQVNLQGNVTSSSARRRKRKMQQDEEWMPGELISSPNNGLKRTYIKGVDGNTSSDSEGTVNGSNSQKLSRTYIQGAYTADGIASSDSEGTVNRSKSQTPAKRNLVNFKVDKSPILGKKKNKKIQNFDECPSRENLQKERQKKPGDTTKSDATDTVLYKPNDVSLGSGLDPFPESATKSEKKSNLLKKKSKMHQDHDWKASPIPWNNNILREGLTSRKDVEMRQTGNVAVPLEVTKEASADKGLQFSPNTCLPAKRYDAKYSTPIRDGPQSLSSWQGRVLGEYDIGRKDLNMNHVGESIFSTKSKVDAYLWKGTRFDLNSKQTTYGIPFLDEKDKHRSPAEVGSSSIEQMDFSGTSNKGKSVEFQDHGIVAREHYDQRAEMTSGKGGVDDIMEIAELMAKNQYERCLPDTEIGKQLPETTSNTKIHQRVDLNKVYENEEMNLFQETTDKLKPRAKNGRIGKILRADNVGTSKQKSVDYFPHIDRNQCNMSQLERSYSPAGFRHFPLCGEKPLNGVQFSATNSIRQNSAQNCQWIGNIVGQKSSHAASQALGVCNACQSAPHQNREATHLWPSMMPNSIPYVHSIPHKCADQVAKLDVLSHCPSSLPKGTMSRNDDQNFLNLSSNFEKYSRKFDSEALRRTHGDYPFSCKHNGKGSLDLYSNETIPAMHLLSLMDAGLQSGAAVNVDGNQKFAKKTCVLPGHRSKEFPSMAFEGYRTNSMKHPSFDSYGKSHLPESFCGCMSVTPALGPSTSSFQHDKSFKKPPDFAGQVSAKSREKEKKKWPDSQRQEKNHRSQKSLSSNSGLNPICGSIPAHSMPKLALGTSDFTIFPTQHRAMEKAKKQKLKTRTTSGTLSYPKSGSENGICRINRNPADFTVPEAGNKYMIRGEDLKFGREAPSSGLVRLVGHKRQRKLTVGKEHLRNRT